MADLVSPRSADRAELDRTLQVFLNALRRFGVERQEASGTKISRLPATNFLHGECRGLHARATADVVDGPQSCQLKSTAHIAVR